MMAHVLTCFSCFGELPHASWLMLILAAASKGMTGNRRWSPTVLLNGASIKICRLLHYLFHKGEVYMTMDKGNAGAVAADDDPESLDVNDFKAFGWQLGEILRDFRDPSLDAVLNERLRVISDAIKKGGASLQAVHLFMGFYDGLCSISADRSKDGA